MMTNFKGFTCRKKSGKISIACIKGKISEVVKRTLIAMFGETFLVFFLEHKAILFLVVLDEIWSSSTLDIYFGM